MSSTAGAVERAPAAVDATSVRRQLTAAIGWAMLALLPTLALVLLARRLGGAFDRPLGGLTIVAVALTLEVTALLIRRLVQSTQHSLLGTKSSFAFGIVSANAVLILASLTLPGTPAVGVAFAWLALVAGEVAQGLFHVRPDLWRLSIAQPGTVSASMSRTSAEEAEIPAGLIQQLTRVREGNRESVHALLRTEIPSGDRLGVFHLSFCPPFNEAPKLTAHAVDTENVEVRITQAESFGARIEVRLPREETAPRGVMIEVLGTVTARPDA